MHSTILALFTSLSLAGAMPTLTSRNGKTDPLLVQYWEAGCGVDGTSNRQTFVVSDEGPSYPGDCFATPNYGWQSVQMTQDSAASYSIDLFSGLGCNNPIIVSLHIVQYAMKAAVVTI